MKSPFATGVRSWSRLTARFCLILFGALLLSLAACKSGPLRSNEVAYVAAPQVNLRDRVAALYNKIAIVKNGDKVEILDRQKRFVRVRTARGEEGWMEQRYLVGEDVFNTFQKLAEENRATPLQGHGSARAELNMHMSVGRDTQKLYQLAEGEKVEVLRRATTERKSKLPVARPAIKPVAGNTASSGGENGQPDREPPAAPKLYDDFWLVRNAQGNVGWVLARMIDLDVPLEIAQYSEGQRIQAAFILNVVQDAEKQVPQYVVLFSENKDGMPFDFNQVRIFTWNVRKHRYETAYRERNLFGLFPVTTSTENFEKEGMLPTFTVHAKNEDGSVAERKYKLNGPIVKRVLAPGEEERKLASTKATKDKASTSKSVRKRRR
ncbi:MAG TPA: SH3 domain-containing protein [Clostridia bacterium]|nr:SH3 domain-containing protein [Clostridia bacterium]